MNTIAAVVITIRQMGAFKVMMIVETMLFLVGVVAAAAFVVKVYEWRQDVLYGPYINSSD